MSLPNPMRFWLLVVGAIAGYLLLIFTNPIRTSLLDGLRSIRRYPRIWVTLFIFGFCYALFQLANSIFLYFVLPPEQKPHFQWQASWSMDAQVRRELFTQSLLPALESVAGIFNEVVTTFPFSAAAALLFLINWQGHFLVMLQTLRKRFGWFGWLLQGFLSLCAAAAIAKPFLYPALLKGTIVLLRFSLVVDWLSFLFEYLFGVCIQIYLILMVYLWVRGVSFTHQHLLDFAIRRFGFVVKWACIVMLLSTAVINLPLMLPNFPPFEQWFEPHTCLAFSENWGRPLLAIFLMLFATVQITLVFHSESLRMALRDHLKFILKNAWPIIWFLLIALLHFYLLNLTCRLIERGAGEGTPAVIAERLLYPLLEAVIAGWLLASWVCLFRRCETGNVEHGEWVKF